ncbi:hypothetical protein [Singulisphaera sp. PoT]|uniref:hypothetical protein n=1 Tax=Singulisphaera sp. PoT TaxID=3411797 RepID=UPI003BF58EA2
MSVLRESILKVLRKKHPISRIELFDELCQQADSTTTISNEDFKNELVSLEDQGSISFCAAPGQHELTDATTTLALDHVDLNATC